MLGMVGHPTLNSAFALWSCLPRRQVLTSETHDALHRVRAHIEAALRLRARGAKDAVAVLTPTGKIEHVEHPEQIAELPALQHHTNAVEQARTRRSSAPKSLSVWQALVAGRWTVVERTESDGKRFYLAFENAPHAVPFRALSARERAVADLSGRGLPGKHVAYALGVSQATVSATLARAADRLGFRSRTDLLRFVGGILGSSRRVLKADLSEAERAVLALLRQGASNRAIAEHRGTSERTVAKQVSALLRKTGADSRRTLFADRDDE